MVNPLFDSFSERETVRAIGERITNEVAAQLAHALKGAPIAAPSDVVELRERCALSLVKQLLPGYEVAQADKVIESADAIVQYILNGKNKEGE